MDKVITIFHYQLLFAGRILVCVFVSYGIQMMVHTLSFLSELDLCVVFLSELNSYIVFSSELKSVLVYSIELELFED